MPVIDNVVCEINRQMLLALNKPSEMGIYGIAEMRRDKDTFKPYILDSNGRGSYVGVNNKHDLSWFWLLNSTRSEGGYFEDEREQYVNFTIVCHYSTRQYKDRAYNVGMQVLGALPDYIEPQPFSLSMSVLKVERLNLDQTDILQAHYGMNAQEAQGVVTDIGFFSIDLALHITYSVNCNPFC
jgi:hypothetical protein